MQIGYFKAKHAFFRFDWNEVEDNCAFVLSRYFHGEPFERKPITKHEHYTQRERVAELFGYRPWAAGFLPQLAHQAALGQLLVRDDTLSQLAALKQDAKDFGWRQMTREREKRATLGPLQRIAKALLPKLGVSQQNVLYYASLANFYTVHDLRNLKADQTKLYLLCYAWVRYRQRSDNLVDAMAYHMKQLEDESSTDAKQSFAAEQSSREQDTPQVGRLLSLYIDDSVPDACGAVLGQERVQHRHFSDDLVSMDDKADDPALYEKYLIVLTIAYFDRLGMLCLI